MLPEELLAKVKKIEWTTRKRIDQALAGQYRSRFKGHGVQFSEHRVYMPGDDVRHIDWKVTARTRDPVLKQYEEERHLQVLLLIDVSPSMYLGSQNRLKSEASAELAALMAFVAIRTGDEVGAIFYSNEVKKVIPPKSGRNHVLRLIQEILSYEEPVGGGETQVSEALTAAMRVMKHSGIVVVISDWLSEEADVELRRVAKKHDLVSIRILDSLEKGFTGRGRVLFYDPESGVESEVDPESSRFRRWQSDFMSKLEEKVNRQHEKAQVGLLTIEVGEGDVDVLAAYLRHRSRGR